MESNIKNTRPFLGYINVLPIVRVIVGLCIGLTIAAFVKMIFTDWGSTFYPVLEIFIYVAVLVSMIAIGFLFNPILEHGFSKKLLPSFIPIIIAWIIVGLSLIVLEVHNHVYLLN